MSGPAPTTQAAGTLYIERPIDPSSAGQQTSESNPLNTLFIVAFAVFISFLAMRLARRGQGK